MCDKLLWRAVNVAATFGAIAFVDRLGRRKLLIIASIWMFVTQIIIAGLLGAEFQKHGAVLPSNVSVGVIVVSLQSLKSVRSSMSGFTSDTSLPCHTFLWLRA